MCAVHHFVVMCRVVDATKKAKEEGIAAIAAVHASFQALIPLAQDAAAVKVQLEQARRDAVEQLAALQGDIDTCVAHRAVFCAMCCTACLSRGGVMQTQSRATESGS